MARQTTQGWAHHGIEVKICGTLFLHPKERRVIMIGSGLQKVKPSHNQGQDATTFNWKSNRQAQEGKIFQQTGLNLGIQQCTD